MTKIAVVFPGQGSQSVGMLNKLAEKYPQIIHRFDQASEILNYDLWQLTQEGPDSTLNQTEYTQPALLVAGVAVWDIWQEQKKTSPSFLAGHSLGEYTALVCAKALAFEDGVRLVAERGRFMQEAVPEGEGAMAALIGLEPEQVRAICHEAAQQAVLSPANFNAIGQIVIAGESAAVERAILLAKEQGAKMAKRLPVSVPSHCALMASAAEKLAIFLDQTDFHPPEIPIVNNVDVTIYQNMDEIRDALIRQLYYPVRWVEIIQFFASQAVELIVECGPGKVLSGLNKRILSDVPTISAEDEVIAA